MSDPTTDLLAKLNQIIEQGTFSLQATEAVSKLREENATLKGTIKERGLQVEKLTGQLNATRTELHVAQVELGKIDAARKVVADREAKVFEHEKAAAVAQAQAETFRHCFGMVFRNTEVKREIFGSKESR